MGLSPQMDGSEKWVPRDPFFTSMIVGETVIFVIFSPLRSGKSSTKSPPMDAMDSSSASLETCEWGTAWKDAKGKETAESIPK